MSEKLYEAIGNIRDELVVRAQELPAKRKKPLRRKLWTSIAAAGLAAAMLVGLLWPGRECRVMAAAKYPDMAPYPLSAESMQDYDRAYAAWLQDVKDVRLPEGAGEALDGFLAKILPAFLENGEDNRVISPLNIYFALGMLAELTEGESRAQLLELLGSNDLEKLRAEAAAIWRATYREDGIVSSVAANSVWISDSFPIRKEPLKTLADNWYASSYRGRMGSTEMNEALQEWLNTQTGGLLQETVKETCLQPEHVLALASTVYFRAKWEEEFNEKRTESGIFYGNGGETDCEFMLQSENKTYYWGERFGAVGQALESGGEMFFILPDEGVSPQDLLADAEVMAFLISGGDWEQKKFLQVSERIPKFDVSAAEELSEGLRGLGITDIFDSEAANFSPLSEEREGIFVSGVQHSARVAIDEEGCTAAAYTLIPPAGAAPGLEDRIEFVLDRPFLFVVTTPDGLPLFVGVVENIG